MKLAIAGGGTGGHLFPALAVAEALCRRQLRPGDILFIGADRGLEARLVPGYGYPLELLAARPFKGQGIAARSDALLRLPTLVVAARRILQRFAARAVLGVGGYASVPTVLAAASLRLPILLQEQNRWPGLANRLLQPLVDKVLGVDAGVARFFRPSKLLVTGNPVPAERASGGSTADFGLERDRLTVLVLGGSRGAVAVNQAVADALPRLSPFAERVQFLHAAGEGEVEPMRAAYARAGIAAYVAPFIERMGAAYGAADAVIARAGAMSCQEIANAGLPSLLIPYPYAANDHQWYNGLRLREVGGALLLRQETVDGEVVAEVVRNWVQDPEERRRQGAAAHALAAPDAADRIADALLASADGTQPAPSDVSLPGHFL
jgi:UDP-N-acetylglucosamine--N-acetylmuramyl-(pentapeptide) pyrophosphoryl-undecaprenol N-acetylglucosamine transferase